MALSLKEQELHINASRDESFAYCSDRTWITKMDKLVKKSPDLFRVVSETDIGKTYRFPKRLISIRSSIAKKHLSAAQRAAAAERLRSVKEK